jgi:hypothetical protein
MSDIKKFARELNEQDPIDFESLAETFDQIFYKEPKGKNPLEAEHVDGVSIRSVGSTEELIQKLQTAKEAKPSFVQIGDREYIFDSECSLSRLIDGIRLGQRND